MSEREVHVREERATREKLGLVGKDLPVNAGVAWCGESCSNEWFFQDASHVLLYLKYGAGPITPCPACLIEMKVVIDKEIL